MIETWVINDGSPVPVASETVLEALRSRVESRQLETWLTSSAGRSLAFVTNTERAMVMLLEEEGDPGEHAADPGAKGASDGFVLSNGQDDEYPDEDTVPIDEAFRLVKQVVSTGCRPTDAHWVVDR
ncbi:Imm1 family immunity protein [Streptomyces anulatus]|uniref:Imm1 family immunity protein n=1 Tax=Streptomyces anulatus TaxID=1892 RepID=UPI0027E33C9E|nr:Imm1 family immunity protein [Streptomyces anulatus]